MYNYRKPRAPKTFKVKALRRGRGSLVKTLNVTGECERPIEETVRLFVASVPAEASWRPELLLRVLRYAFVFSA